MCDFCSQFRYINAFALLKAPFEQAETIGGRFSDYRGRSATAFLVVERGVSILWATLCGLLLSPSLVGPSQETIWACSNPLHRGDALLLSLISEKKVQLGLSDKVRFGVKIDCWSSFVTSPLTRQLFDSESQLGIPFWASHTHHFSSGFTTGIPTGQPPEVWR